jgi:stage II sporulation protein D
MRRLVGCAFILLAASLPARAQEFRVDLFTRSGVSETVITPGIAAVELCPARGPCATIAPGESLKCSADAGEVFCRSKGGSHKFRRVVARSASVFRLDVTPTDAMHEAPSRGVTVRSAEIRMSDSNLRAVAEADLETYVAGVLAGEAATFKSSAAIDAMAVLARTWALASRGRHRAEGYDFCSLTHCQFFRPPIAPDASDAAARTAGRVLKYQGRLIDAYYSAHCGGQTASAASVWPDRAATYLVSVADPACARDGRTWEQKISWADLNRVLREDVIPGLRGEVRDLQVEKVDASGRALTLRLAGDSSRVIDAHTFRYAINRRLGWNTLKSSMFTIRRNADGLIFRGRGLGHGVGLCQNGAEQMGQSGASFQRILAHYFPGTAVERAEESRSRVLSSEHFELTFPIRDEALASRALEILEAEQAALGARSRRIPPRITVRSYTSAAEFGLATGQPGWVAGASDGRSIDLQPLSLLDARGILRSTIRHELLHLVIHRLRAPDVPRWYEEGMILYLAGENITTPPALPSSDEDRAKMERSYARARARVVELARRRGEGALWEVLHKPTADDLAWFKKPD